MKTYITYDANANPNGLVQTSYGEWSHTMNHSGYIDITNDGIENLCDHLQPGDEIYICSEGTYTLHVK